jgi:hypothetical protein
MASVYPAGATDIIVGFARSALGGMKSSRLTAFHPFVLRLVDRAARGTRPESEQVPGRFTGATRGGLVPHGLAAVSPTSGRTAPRNRPNRRSQSSLYRPGYNDGVQECSPASMISDGESPSLAWHQCGRATPPSQSAAASACISVTARDSVTGKRSNFWTMLLGALLASG